MSFIKVTSIVGTKRYVNINKIQYVTLNAKVKNEKGEIDHDREINEITFENGDYLRTYEDVTPYLDFKD